MPKYTCFVISPIGESGSDTRKAADFLLNLIISPVLKEFGFEVLRGDHRAEGSQIDQDVIKSVQEADLCICNISEPNLNVYYELGRRDETGKPVFLMKEKNSEGLPVDIATRRYIEYDLGDPQGILDAMNQLRKYTAPLVEGGLESVKQSVSLNDLAETLERIERKIGRLESSAPAAPADTGSMPANSKGLSLREQFRLAILKQDVAAAEALLDRVRNQTDIITFYDYYVEQTASLGSMKAGKMMIDYAETFIDSTASFNKKTEYISYLVSFSAKRNIEGEVQELVEKLVARLQAVSDDESPADRSTLFNQLNRLYYGMYINTKDATWLQKAIDQLKKALRIYSANYLHYNLALCLKQSEDYEAARFHAEESIKLDKKDDANHLELLCELYYRLNDPKFPDTLEKLTSVSEGKATLLKQKLGI